MPKHLLKPHIIVIRSPYTDMNLALTSLFIKNGLVANQFDAANAVSELLESLHQNPHQLVVMVMPVVKNPKPHITSLHYVIERTDREMSGQTCTVTKADSNFTANDVEAIAASVLSQVEDNLKLFA